MSVSIKAEAWAWRFTQTIKQLTRVQNTSESRLANTLEILKLVSRNSPVTLETGKLKLPVTLENGESGLPSFQSTREFL